MMKPLRTITAFAFCASLAVAAAAAAAEGEVVAADSFITLCEQANKNTETKEIEALLAQAQSQKALSDAQLQEAKDELTAAYEALTGVVLSEVLKIDNQISELNRQIEALRREQFAISEMLGTKKGSEYAALFRSREEKRQQRESLEEQVKGLSASRDALRRVAESEGETGATALERAGRMVSMISEIGGFAALSFAAPVAQWTAAKLSLTAAGATDEAAVSAIDCIGKRLAVIAKLEGEEKKYLRNNVIELGNAMKAKFAEVKTKEKEIKAFWEKNFKLLSSNENFERGLTALTEEYLKLLKEYTDLGVQFENRLASIQSKGEPLEPWMSQLLDHYKQAKQALDEAVKKQGG